MKITPVRNSGILEEYKFYPTTNALKIAFLLGEVKKIIDVPDVSFHGQSMETYRNISVQKTMGGNALVTLFYNTVDPTLSDKKLRDGLSYALPDSFKDGQRNYLPYSPQSFYFNADLPLRKEDLSHAKILIDSSLSNASSSAVPLLTLKTLDKYQNAAKEVSNEWKKVGVKTKIVVVSGIPADFQMYLGDFNVAKAYIDPGSLGII